MNSFLRLALLGSLSVSLHAQDASETVLLDPYEVTANAEGAGTLSLDAEPTTGSRLGLPNRDLPASVSIITRETIKLRGFRTAVEAVEGAVGMTGGTQFGGIPGFATRGFTGNAVTVLRDGIRQNTASQSSRTVDSFNLDRIEVLKGPASLMFGEGAVGGAINYLSKSPDHTWQGEAFSSFGSWGNVRLGAGAGGPLVGEKLFFRFDVSHNDHDGYVERNKQRYTGVTAALGWDVSPAFMLTYYTTWLDDSNESYYGNPVIYDAVDRLDPLTGNVTRIVAAANPATDRLVNPRVERAARRTNYNITDNLARTRNTFHRIRASWKPASDWEVQNESYLANQDLKWRNLETNRWNPVTGLVDRSSFLHIFRDDTLAGNRIDVTRKASLFGRPNRVLAGVLLETNNLTRGGTPSGLPSRLGSVTLLNPDVGTGPGDPGEFQKNARIDIDTRAFYIENVFEMTDNIKIVTGLRHDGISIRRDTLVTPDTPEPGVFRKRFTPVTGRAGAVWSVNRNLNLYGSYSRAAEPVTQLVSFTAARDSFSLQTGRQFEFGAKGSLPAKGIDFTLALYDIEKNDLLSSTLDPDTGLRISQQIGAQVSQGAELAVAWLVDGAWQFDGNFAWTWKAAFRDFNENLGSGVVSRDGNTPPNVPEVVASAHLSRTFGRWRAGGGARYVDKRPANNANFIWTPSYVAIDASVSYGIGRWTATLRGRNLLDEDFEEWATDSGLMQRLADPRSWEIALHTSF